MSGYVLEGPKWSSTTITWSFAATNYAQDTSDTYSSYITQTAYQSVIEQALAKWASVSGVTFVQVADGTTASTAADIRFGFGDLPISTTGEIGETTYYYSGTTMLPDVVIQLEDPADKALVTNTSSGLTYSGTTSTLYQVVLHEIGHALGLGHTLDTNAIMNATATASNRDLDSTDISGIQALYGPPVASVTAPSTTNTTTTPTATTTVSTTPGTENLQGTHSQYTIAVTPNGALTVDDNVASRDGDQTVSGITVLQFTDGQALIDPDGVLEDVARIYYAAFGSIGDVSGLAYWAAQIRGGASEISVIQGFEQSPQFVAYAAMSNSDFVTTVYEQTLGRAPDSSGLSYWTGLLSSGTDRSALLLSMANVPELRQDLLTTQGDTTDAEVYRLYTAALGRTPDTSGLDYWSGVLSAGTSALQIAQGFIASPEYQQTYGGLANAGFVNALYENVLGRAADTTGAAYWNTALQSGTSRASVLLNFSDSLENRTGTAAATHANWIFIQS